jgi:hypothetical protein
MRFLGRQAELGSLEVEAPRVTAATTGASSFAAGPPEDVTGRGAGASAVDGIATSRARAAALLTAGGAFGEVSDDDNDSDGDGIGGRKRPMDCALLLYEAVKLVTDVICLGVAVALAALVLSPAMAKPMLEDALQGLVPKAADVTWGDSDRGHMSSAGVFLYLRQIQDRMLLPVVCVGAPALLIMVERVRGWANRRCERAVEGESGSDGAE